MKYFIYLIDLELLGASITAVCKRKWYYAAYWFLAALINLVALRLK